MCDYRFEMSINKLNENPHDDKWKIHPGDGKNGIIAIWDAGVWGQGCGPEECNLYESNLTNPEQKHESLAVWDLEHYIYLSEKFKSYMRIYGIE